jgi:transposase
MSLHPHVIAPVPEETARVARAAFPKGHPYLTFRDALGTIFQDEDFAALFPLGGQPGLPPWRLAFVTIMQFRETLTDRQAAEAVRARIDWKYLLSLELTDPGFDFSVLSEFRDRLLAGPKSSSSTSSWSAARGWACSRRGGSSAPTPRTCWPRSVSSTVSNSLPKPCGRP